MANLQMYAPGFLTRALTSLIVRVSNSLHCYLVPSNLYLHRSALYDVEPIWWSSFNVSSVICIDTFHQNKNANNARNLYAATLSHLPTSSVFSLSNCHLSLLFGVTLMSCLCVVWTESTLRGR